MPEPDPAEERLSQQRRPNQNQAEMNDDQETVSLQPLIDNSTQENRNESEGQG
jgi:hypothetical protein